MTDNIKLIKGEVNGNVNYFLSKNQCGVFYNINAGSVYCMLEKGGNSNKCIGLKLSYIPYDKELKIEKQPDKRIGRRKYTVNDIEHLREVRRINARRFNERKREKILLERQEKEKEKNIQV